MSAFYRAAIAAVLGGVSAAGWAQSFDYTAAENLFDEPVTVSVTGKPERASEVPADMEIITADDIRRSGAANIPDVLRFVAGVDVRRYGQQDAAVGIRGYNTALNPRVLVLVDGRQVYQDDYGFTPWALIPVPLVSIRQIEVIKGPSAALYGFNAVSGVINIVTYDPLHDKQNAAQLRAGTQAQRYGEVVATAQSRDQWGARLSATRRRADPLEGGQAYEATTTPRATTAAIDAAYQVTPGIEWRLSGSVGDTKAPYYPDIGYYVPLSDRGHSVRSTLSADTRFGLVTLDAYRNDASVNLDIIDGTRVAWDENVTVIRLSDLFRVGNRHTFRLGTEYRHNQAGSAQSFSGQINESIVSGSAMWDWQLTPRWSVTNAVRVDALSVYHDGPQFDIPSRGGLFTDTDTIEPSFNSGLVFKASDYDTLRLTAARAYQLPSLLDFGFAQNFGGVLTTGNPRLQPAEVTNYEFDYDRQLTRLASKLEFSVFAQFTDTTVGSPFGSGLTILPTYQPLLQADNFGDSHEYGGEVEFSGDARGYRWKASYALTSVHDDTPDTRLSGAPSVSYARQTPTSAVVLGAGRSWGQIELDAQARWQSHYTDYTFAPNVLGETLVGVDDYVTLDARLAYALTPYATVSVNAQQLNAHRQQVTAGRDTERQVTFGLALDF